MKHITRILLALPLLLLLAGAGGGVVESLAGAGALRSYPPHGHMIEVNGLRMRLNCAGSGAPTVIFDAGWADTGLVWQDVQERVARRARSCTYDRAGLGWSDPAPGGAPLTAADAALRLYQLLQAAGEPGPYLLVGHDLGAANLRMFALAYPQDTAGLVLVEAATLESFAARSPAQARRDSADLVILGVAARLAPAGLHRLFFSGGLTPVDLPAAWASAGRAVALRAPGIQTAYRERLGWKDSLRQAGPAEPGSLGDLPLVVLIAARPAPVQDEAAHVQALGLLAGLSARGRQVIVENSDSYIHLRRPEVVAEAVEGLLP